MSHKNPYTLFAKPQEPTQQLRAVDLRPANHFDRKLLALEGVRYGRVAVRGGRLARIDPQNREDRAGIGSPEASSSRREYRPYCQDSPAVTSALRSPSRNPSKPPVFRWDAFVAGASLALLLLSLAIVATRLG